MISLSLAASLSAQDAAKEAPAKEAPAAEAPAAEAPAPKMSDAEIKSNASVGLGFRAGSDFARQFSQFGVQIEV